ncbi:sirohydrochlorin chelatase [Streptoalloteichus hindustanus]|uniref:sirohydrochlorin chelatase n=1 Tax=Streptoalloteichus hindustanus TaxID=2017 RepID=UPI000936C21A|nr:sirohydrochlorin chelatase [Streptoalloteichus hindustanus]
MAHGSRDPRSAASVAALLEVVRALRPGLDVRLSFLDLSAPRLTDVLAGVAGEGHRRAVVVPLLLGDAYHARVDVPGAVAEATGRHPRLEVLVSDVLGPDPRLESAALRRLAAAGAHPGDPGIGVVLAAAGSSHPPANAAVADVARRWAAGAGWAGVEVAFAAAEPDVASAVARLRARGARRVALGSWFLAPGLLPDRVRAQARAVAPGALLADPLGPDPEVAELVVQRYLTAEPASTARYA